MSLSDSSDLSSGETVYTLDDLQEMGIISKEVAEWIKKNPLPPDDPLLCLTYYCPLVAARAGEIAQALVDNGAKEVTPTAIFNFAKKDDINTARENMLDTHLWSFYDPRGIQVPGHLLNQHAQWVLSYRKMKQFLQKSFIFILNINLH